MTMRGRNFPIKNVIASFQRKRGNPTENTTKLLDCFVVFLLAMTGGC